MKVAGILVLAALAGYAVYRLSLRAAGEGVPSMRLWGRVREHHGRAAAHPAVGPSAAPQAFGSVSLQPLDTVPWYRRLIGLAELIGLVAVSSGILAFTAYKLAQSVRVAFEKWAGG